VKRAGWLALCDRARRQRTTATRVPDWCLVLGLVDWSCDGSEGSYRKVGEDAGSGEWDDADGSSEVVVDDPVRGVGDVVVA
jgi:hypothetical protein